MGFYKTPDTRLVSKSITFDGTAGLGAIGTVTFFTVTGEVLIEYIVPYCVASLTQAAPSATMELGFPGNTGLLAGLLNPVTVLTTGEFWLSNVGDIPPNSGASLTAAQKDAVATANIIATVGAQAVNGGTLRLDVIFRPLSSDGNVVPA